jgi:hypothetical protein
MLSVESFKMANDPNVPEQLQFVKPCKLKTIFLILHGGFMVFNAADKTNLISSNGNLLQQSRESNQEIAALSRSRHQSQGFGSTGVRGEETEYLEFINGKL